MLSKGIRYDLSNAAASSPVSFEGGRIRFAQPQPFEKALSAGEMAFMREFGRAVHG